MVKILTFGCRLNTVESQIMKSHAEAGGHEEAIIVNTCAVTGEAVRQARQAIRRARRDHPNAKIIVTGCAAQVEPETFTAMEAVDVVLGNDEKLQGNVWQEPDFGLKGSEKARVNDIMSIRDTAHHLVQGFDGRSRAFVQVQNGCDHRCTFCIIPYGRGPSRSVPMGMVVNQVRTLVENGYGEVVLTGVDMTSYGSDLPGTPKLGQLVRNILLHVPELQRLRLSSIDSIEADQTLIDAFAEEERLMPHLHLSLQAGDDMILKRMKRRHSRQQSIDFCDHIRRLRPDIVFGADFIAGFPTETNIMFENTLSFIEECGLTHLHVFPFSARHGTPAARMPQISKGEIKTRASRLRAAGQERLTGHLQAENGQVRQVLIERAGHGRTEYFTETTLTNDTEFTHHKWQNISASNTPDTTILGTIVAARIIGHTGRQLVAELI